MTLRKDKKQSGFLQQFNTIQKKMASKTGLSRAVLCAVVLIAKRRGLQTAPKSFDSWTVVRGVATGCPSGFVRK